MLAKIRHLPDTSAFRTAQDWPLRDHLLARLCNEIMGLRGDMWALLGNQQMKFDPILPPTAQREQDTKRATVRAVHDKLIAQLRGQKLNEDHKQDQHYGKH